MIRSVLIRIALLAAVSSIACIPGRLAAETSFEPHDTIKAGIRPLYALIFGEYAGQYRHAPGFLAYARGGYRLNIEKRLMIYPEFSWGFLHCVHKSERDRRMYMFPFAINLFFDATFLNFHTKAGRFVLKPFIGLGIYLNDYKSRRKKATGGDFGCQAGINLEYSHVGMQGAYVEASIDHLGTTNFRKYLPALAFSLGAGYAFPIGKTIERAREQGRGSATITEGAIKEELPPPSEVDRHENHDE